MLVRPVASVTLLPLLVALLVLVPGAPSRAAAAAPSALTASVPSGYAGDPARVRVVLRDAEGLVVPGATVTVERRVGGTWRTPVALVTDGTGAAVLTATRARTTADNVWRASYAGDETHEPATPVVVRGALTRRNGVVRITGQRRLKDERTARLRVVSTTGSGAPVQGWVRIERALPGRGWRWHAALRTGPRGLATFKVAPRTDTRWRATTKAQDWVRGDRSPVHALDNVPLAAPVRLPAGAPTPRLRLPAQARATKRGPAPVVTTIPDDVWSDMVGRSWHAGCPVGREGLRLLRINYWGYDGYRYRGEVVAATSAIDNVERALVAMYQGRYPIRSMYRVDRFGYSSRVRGADDYASMDAGNTSAFNCRDVVGKPGVRSPHSYGRSLDVNTWENPYRSARGLVPNSWWQPRSHPRVAWRSGDHAVVRIFRAAGFSWTYGTGDSQHFDVPGSSGRVIAPTARACRDVVCH